MGTLHADKINRLDILYSIKENMYRSKDAQKDYDPESVDERIWHLEGMKQEQAETKWEDEAYEKDREDCKRILANIREIFPHLTEETRMKVLIDVSPIVSDFV